MRSLLMQWGWRTPGDPSPRQLRRQVRREMRAIWAEAATPAELLFRRSEEFKDRLVALGEPAVPALAAAVTGRVKRNSDFVQVTAVQALAELGGSSAAARLDELLDDPQTEGLMRRFLLSALVQVDPSRGLPRVRRMLFEGIEPGGDPSEESSAVKASAALSQVAGSGVVGGREEIFDLLAECLEAENTVVRGHAVTGLHKLGDRCAVPYLAAALVQKRNATKVAAITEALVALGGREEVAMAWHLLSAGAKRQLLRGLSATDVECRRFFFELFERAAVDQDEDVRSGVALVLTGLPEERATGLLVELLGRAESHRTLAPALAALLERGAADRLLSVWPDFDRQIRLHLLQRLQDDPVEEEREQRILLLRRGLADDDSAVAMVAAESIAELDERELLTELRAALPRLQSGHRQLQEERAGAALEGIPLLAETCVQTTRDVFGRALAYEEASLSWLDDVVRHGWPAGGPVHEATVGMFAAYVGETVRRVHGGHWQVRDDQELVLVGVGQRDLVVRPSVLVRHAFERPAGSTFGDAHARIRAALRSGEPAVIE